MDGPNVHVPYGDLVYNLKIKQGHGDKNGHSFISVFIRKIRRIFTAFNSMKFNSVECNGTREINCKKKNTGKNFFSLFQQY